MKPEDLSSLIGEDAALHLMARRGGQRMYVPMSVTDDLMNAIGGNRDAATKLSAEYGRNVIVIPMGRRWRIMRMRDRGMNVRETALALSMTERGVRQAVAQIAARSAEQRSEAA